VQFKGEGLSADSVGVKTPALPPWMNGWVETHPYQPLYYKRAFRSVKAPAPSTREAADKSAELSLRG
jgi:hypothetical protein